MFFNRVLRNEQCISDLLIAHSFTDQFQHFVFSFADVELGQLFLIKRKIFFWDEDFLFHDLLFLQFPAEEDADEKKDDAESSDPYFGTPS